MHCQEPLKLLLEPLKKGTKKVITVVGIMVVGIYLVLSTTLLYASATYEIVSKSSLRWSSVVRHLQQPSQRTEQRLRLSS